MRRVLAEAAVIWLVGLVWSGLTRWWGYNRTVEAMHETLREPTT